MMLAATLNPLPSTKTGAMDPSRLAKTTRSVDDLTNLAWLQKPGVLTSMCTALTGSPHRINKTGPRGTRKTRFVKGYDSRKKRRGDSDKMVNVILNVRNRKYGEHKPLLSFACMIFMAIESSPTKMLPVKDIYEWIIWMFPYYHTARPGWKNSVRHNLSLNKCFRKVDRRVSLKMKSAHAKGGLWTVDPDYRRSLLAALERSPYHPYHRYFSPPLSPSSSNSSFNSLDPAEREAALTMCMIGGVPEHCTNVTPGLLHAIYHDHGYAKRPPPVTISIPIHTGLTLDEVAAAAELILQQDAERELEEEEESSDEGFGGEESDGESECGEEDGDGESECGEEDGDGESECGEEDGDGDEEDLGDSGFDGVHISPSDCMKSSCSMEEMGADALLCLAGSSRSSSPPH